MDDTRRFQLLYGPYRAPRCRIGKRLMCKLRGTVNVTGISDALIQWPQTKRKGGGRPFLIVCGSLARAIQREAAIAICHWWGVTPQTVSVWRKTLGVPRGNAGTRRLHRDWLPELRDDEALYQHRPSLKSPERAAKIARANRGKRRPPEVMAKAQQSNVGRKRTAEARRTMSVAQKRRGAYPPTASRPFTPEENKLMGSMLDREMAAMIGRATDSLSRRRKKLGVANCKERCGNGAGRRELMPNSIPSGH